MSQEISDRHFVTLQQILKLFKDLPKNTEDGDFQPSDRLADVDQERFYFLMRRYTVSSPEVAMQIISNLRETLSMLGLDVDQQESDGKDQVLDDILVWRGLLMYILFSTTLDSTPLISLSTLDHIVPIL